jgi:hypothetical protein
MLFRLLKSVKNWAFDFIFDNKLADVETRLYVREIKDDSNKG